MATLLLVLSGPVLAQLPAPEECAVLDVDRVGWDRLTATATDPAVTWWVEAGSRLLACGEPGVAQDLLQPFVVAAALHTDLVISTSTHAWGSDHVPYLDRDMPALLTIENDWDSYPDYHRTTDLPANLTLEMGRQILRMNVGALAEMTGAAAGLLFRDSFESGNLEAWSAVQP